MTDMEFCEYSSHLLQSRLLSCCKFYSWILIITSVFFFSFILEEILTYIKAEGSLQWNIAQKGKRVSHINNVQHIDPIILLLSS